MKFERIFLIWLAAAAVIFAVAMIADPVTYRFGWIPSVWIFGGIVIMGGFLLIGKLKK